MIREVEPGNQFVGVESTHKELLSKHKACYN